MNALMAAESPPCIDEGNKEKKEGDSAESQHTPRSAPKIKPQNHCGEEQENGAGEAGFKGDGGR
jgi:hypothetical protein